MIPWVSTAASNPDGRTGAARWEERHSVRLLLAFFLLGGLAYAFLIPPFEAPDEFAHFARAYGIAEGQFVLKDHPREIVVYLRSVSEELLKRRNLEHVEEGFSVRDIDRYLDTHGERIPNLLFNTSLYSPVPYVPHAAVIRLAGVLDKAPGHLLLQLYLCRLASLTLFMVMLWFSLRLSPPLLWPVFWVAATPMALAQSAMMSIDAIVLGVSLILLSAALGHLRGVVDLAVVALATFVLLMSKPPYLPIAALPFFAAWRSSAEGSEVRPRATVVFAAAFGFGLLSCLGWTYWVKAAGQYDLAVEFMRRYISTQIDPAAQFGWVLENPLGFGKSILTTMRTQGVVLYHQMIGVFAWLDVPLPLWSAIGWGVFVPVAVFQAGFPAEKRGRLLVIGALCLLAALGTFLSVAFVGYLIWTPFASDSVPMQGRYFHPIVAAALFGVAALKPFGQKKGLRQMGGWVLFAAGLFLNLLSMQVILRRFWI